MHTVIAIRIQVRLGEMYSVLMFYNNLKLLKLGLMKSGIRVRNECYNN